MNRGRIDLNRGSAGSIVGERTIAGNGGIDRTSWKRVKRMVLPAIDAWANSRRWRRRNHCLRCLESVSLRRRGHRRFRRHGAGQGGFYWNIDGGNIDSASKGWTARSLRAEFISRGRVAQRRRKEWGKSGNGHTRKAIV